MCNWILPFSFSYFMKMENAGFMMNHYWNVSVLQSIRLGNARFAPGDPGRRHNEVTVFLWENLFTPFLLQWFLSQGYWTFWCRWTSKARKASLFLFCGSYNVDFGLEKNFRFWKQDVCSFSKSHVINPSLKFCTLVLLLKYTTYVS